MGAKSFEELYAWQLALKFCEQLRASARPAPRLIAEGFGRFGRREFRRYLSMARAELLEVQNDLIDLKCRRYVPDEHVEELRRLADHAARVTARLRSSIPDR